MREVVQKSALQWQSFQRYQGTSFWNHCFILEGDLQFYFRNVNEEKNKASTVVVVPKLLQEQLTHMMFPAHRFQCYCTEQSTRSGP